MCKTFYLVNFVLFHRIWLYSNGALRHISKSNPLNETEIKRYHLCGKSWSWFIWYWFHGNITINIDYSKFKRFSNVVDEVSAKVLSSFLEYEVLVVVTDWYDFEFSIKAANRKRRTEDSAHIQEIGAYTVQHITWQAKVVKELIFISPTKKLTQKCLRMIIFVRTGSSLFCQTLMLRWYLYIKESLTLHP